MKQVMYEFDWMMLVSSIVHEYNLEDGFWKVDVLTESFTGAFPKLVDGQQPVTLPGHLVRFTGLRFSKTNNYGPLTIKVDEGIIHYGPDTDNDRLDEDSRLVG